MGGFGEVKNISLPLNMQISRHLQCFHFTCERHRSSRIMLNTKWTPCCGGGAERRVGKLGVRVTFSSFCPNPDTSREAAPQWDFNRGRIGRFLSIYIRRHIHGPQRPYMLLNTTGMDHIGGHIGFLLLPVRWATANDGAPLPNPMAFSGWLSFVGAPKPCVSPQMA